MIKDTMKIHGFSRVRIKAPGVDSVKDPGGEIVGDSGWTGPNSVVNLGFRQYMCMAIGSEAGSKYVGFVSLGEGTEPASANTTLESECSGTGGVPIRPAVTAASSGSTTEQFTATLGSSDSFVTATESIANIGLWNATTSNETIFAGNTFASSTCATNQDVNVTYQIRFS